MKTFLLLDDDFVVKIKLWTSMPWEHVLKYLVGSMTRMLSVEKCCFEKSFLMAFDLYGFNRTATELK